MSKVDDAVTLLRARPIKLADDEGLAIDVVLDRLAVLEAAQRTGMTPPTVPSGLCGAVCGHGGFCSLPAHCGPDHDASGACQWTDGQVTAQLDSRNMHEVSTVWGVRWTDQEDTYVGDVADEPVERCTDELHARRVAGQYPTAQLVQGTVRTTWTAVES